MFSFATVASVMLGGTLAVRNRELVTVMYFATYIVIPLWKKPMEYTFFKLIL